MPNQLIRGIRDLLREDVAPELTSERAVTSLRKIMAILRDFDWNEAAFRLARENTTLRSLAEEVLAWIDEAPSRRLNFSAAREELSAAVDLAHEADSFARIHDVNLACRRAIAVFVEIASKGAHDAAALRARMAAALAAHCD